MLLRTSDLEKEMSTEVWAGAAGNFNDFAKERRCGRHA